MPAEDTLTYRVEVDAADLPQQLEQLRAQMDTALGAMAFSNQPPPPEMAAGPMNFMFETAPQNAAQHMIDTTSQGFLATNQMMATQEQGGLMNFLNSNVEAFRLGYAKFHGGMERMGLMVPPAPLVSFPPQGVTAYTEQMEHLQGLGYPGGPLFTATGMINSAAEMPGLMGGALGFGYDPNTMPYSRFEFQEMYGEAAGKRISRGLEGNLFTLGGGALGLAFGPGGGLIGAGVGMAADALVFAGGQRRRQGEQVGAAFRKISQRSQMQDAFTKEEGEELANELLGQADTYEARINRVTRDSIQSQLLDFTREGGFDSARSADEFKQTAQGVIDNTRKIMQTLRMTQEEATKFMAEMNREGLLSTTDSSGFALDVAMNAKVAGIDPIEMMNFMKQGSEAFRGSAYGMGGGMQMLQEARLSTQQLLQTVPIGQDIIRELGGVQQATIGLAQGNANFMQTGMGMIGYNNLMRGGASGDMMAAMANTYGMSPFDWYRERAQMTQDVASGVVSQQDITGLRLDPYIQRYQDHFQRVEGRGMGAEDYEGMFHWMTQAGITENVAQAQQLFATRFADPDIASDRRMEALNDQLDKLRQPQPVTIGDQFRAVMGEIGDVFMDPLRQIDASLHGIFDPLGEYITDWATGRTELTDRQKERLGGTAGVVEKSIAMRVAAGDLTTQESTFLETTIKDYEAHLEASGGVLDTINYNILDKNDRFIQTSADKEFQGRLDAAGGTVNQFLGGFSWDQPGLGLLPRDNAAFTPPSADYSTFAMDEHLQDLLTGFEAWEGASIRYLGGVDTAGLETALGEDFVFGRLDPTSKLGQKTGVHGGTWSDHDMTGIDSLIIGQMMAEGTLTRKGELMSTRGNLNNNPANIRIQSATKHGTPLETAEYYYGEWGVTGIDEAGFVQFETLYGGFNAARQEALVSIRKGQTVRQFFHEQSPSADHNDPDAMAKLAVATAFGLTNVSPWEESIDDLDLEVQFARITDMYQTDENGKIKRDENGDLILKGDSDSDAAITSDQEIVATQEGIYKVQGGDTFGAIAEMHGVGMSVLKELNPDITDFDKIRVGQKINIPVVERSDMTLSEDGTLQYDISELMNYDTSIQLPDVNDLATFRLDKTIVMDPLQMSNYMDANTPSDRFKTGWAGSGGDYSAGSYDPNIALVYGKIDFETFKNESLQRRRSTLGFGQGYTGPGATYLLDQETRDLMATEDMGFLKDLTYDMAATFIKPTEQGRMGHLVEFISTMGGNESLTLSAENIGLFNRDGQFADMSQGLYLHGKAIMQYNTLAAYDSKEIRTNISSAAFREKYEPSLFEGYATAVGDALTAHGNEFENEVLGKLNIAAGVLHEKGLISASTIADIETAGELELIRNTLYQADPKGYSETFLNRADGDSLASSLAAHGSTYGDTILNQAGDNQTLSLPVQALNWKIAGLQKEMEGKLDPKSIIDKVKGTDAFEALEGTSSWLEASEGAYDDDDYNTFWGSIMFGAGAIMTATGFGSVVGTPLMVAGGGMIGMDTVEAGMKTWESANTTHLAKIMARMRVTDESLFMTQEDMEKRYGTRNMDELTGEQIQEMFVTTIQQNQVNGTNAFLEDLQHITNLQLDGQAGFDAGVTEHLQNAVTLGYNIQNELTAQGIGSDSDLLSELRMARGLRAGLLNNKQYTMFNASVGGDAGTYENIMAVRQQLVDERKKKQKNRTKHRAAIDMLAVGSYGADSDMMMHGKTKTVNGQEIRQIQSFEQWFSEETASSSSEFYGDTLNAAFNPSDISTYGSIDPAHKKAYDQYVQTTNMTMIAGEYGFADSKALKEYGMDTLIANKVQDDSNVKTIREATKDMTLDDPENQQVALLLASNQKLETLITVLKEGNMD